MEVQWEASDEHISKRTKRSENDWERRRSIAKNMGTAASRNELDFTAEIISSDAKNYHAWYHRQWTLKEIGDKSLLKLSVELDYCDEILKNDGRNPFAWNQRLFVVMCTAEAFSAWKHTETLYALRAISRGPDNEYPWICLRYLHHDDTASLCFDYNDFYVEVLEMEVFRAEVASERDAVKFKIDPHLNVDILMNRRGCVHALNLVLEFLVRGYKPEPESDLVRVINSLYSKSDNSRLEDRVRSIIRSLDVEVKWRDSSDESVDDEQIQSFCLNMGYLEAMINQVSESRTSPPE